MLGSLKIIHYQDFIRSSDGIRSNELNQDLRAWEITKKVVIDYANDAPLDLRKTFESKEKVFEYSQEFLKMFPFVTSLSKNKREDFLYNYLNYSQYEIGDRIPMNSKAVGLFLIREKRSRFKNRS